MAGVKGRSGGARPGSGPKPRPPQTEIADAEAGNALPSEAEAFLRLVMLGQVVPSVPQLEAAKMLARLHAAPAGGKKEAAKNAAKQATAGRFSPASAPKLVVNNR